ncbi:alcohol dehydrogenase catalytic domain-containing protein [Glutamicibacter endophyticus]|uniref:alcohol dehydrogenase catalytic domain-containing protein n=1 Tax=Glutamicibacter endophyticus TaxID=1522174 RepID=UPI003AF068E4
MKATFLHGQGDIRVEEVQDARIVEPSDALVRVVRSCICGSDLHPYRSDRALEKPAGIGHEFIGEVLETGSEVSSLRAGDLVIGPFMVSCGNCEMCVAGLFTSCLHGGGYSAMTGNGCQAELIRVPLAEGTLVPVEPGISPEHYASLLTLSDVYGTGFHAAHTAKVSAGDTVAVIGDGAVGLLAVLSAQQLGAERIILMGRHQARTDLGRQFGATDVVAERGAEGIARVRELAGGLGVHKVLEAVGHMPAFEQALGIVRPGGTISRVGVPQYSQGHVGRKFFGNNITLTGGVAPVRGYVKRLLPGILDGSVNPGLVFDAELPLERAAEGYAAMDQRRALKVMLVP